jgi:hypothetical protein
MSIASKKEYKYLKIKYPAKYLKLWGLSTYRQIGGHYMNKNIHIYTGHL